MEANEVRPNRVIRLTKPSPTNQLVAHQKSEQLEQSERGGEVSNGAGTWSVGDELLEYQDFL